MDDAQRLADAILADASVPVEYMAGEIRPAPEMAVLQVGDTMWVELRRDGMPPKLTAGEIIARTETPEAVQLTARCSLDDGAAVCHLTVRIPRGSAAPSQPGEP